MGLKIKSAFVTPAFRLGLEEIKIDDKTFSHCWCNNAPSF